MEIARILSLLVVVLFGFCVEEIRAGKYCYTGYGFTLKYCRYGCCGSTFDRYCCSVDVGLIVGGVIGGIIFISVIIAVICCCIKKQTHSGRVVRPAGTHGPQGGANVMVMYSGSSGAQPYYGPPPMGAGAQPMPPPAYKQFEGSNPPPAYNYTNPAAYPPSNPAYPPPLPPIAGGGPAQVAPVNPNPFSTAAQGVSPSAPLQPPPPGFSVGGGPPAAGGMIYSAPPPAATTR